MKIAEKVKEFFHNEGIHSTTIQPEFTEVHFRFGKKCFLCFVFPRLTLANTQLPTDESASETESACALDCPAKDRSCAASTCCGPSKQVPQESDTDNDNLPIPGTADPHIPSNSGGSIFHINIEDWALTA